MGPKLTRSTIVDLLQVVVCLVVLSLAITAFRDRHAHEEAAAGYAAGAQMEALPGVQFAERERTLVLFESSGCTFCTQSMPFYKKLSKELKSRGISFVAASPEPVHVSQAYFKSHGVAVDQVVQKMFSRQVAGTPTLVLVDRRGTVTDAWVGSLDQAGEKRVLKKLASD